MSKGKYTGRLRKLSDSKNDLIPQRIDPGKAELSKYDILKSDSSKYDILKSELSKCDVLPSLTTPTFTDDLYDVDKTSKSSKKLRQWLNGDSSSDTSLMSTSSCDDGLRIRKSSKIEKLSEKNSQYSLQQELMECRDEMERMRDRLADRDLEIKILQKRMSLRRASSQNSEDIKINGSLHCTKCREKDGLVADLYQKMKNLENVVEAFCSTDEKNSTSNLIDITDPDLNQILQNVSDLNQIVTENQKDIQYVANGALFQKPSVIGLTFFKDGFRLGDAVFRSFRDDQSKSFLKDLLDGFFPTELQTDHPEGVIFLVEDRRFESGNGIVNGRTPFSGIGRCLQSRPGSAKSIFPPIPNSSRPGSVLSSSSKLKPKNVEAEFPKFKKDATAKNKPHSSSCPKNDGAKLKKYAPFKRTASKGGPSSGQNDVCSLKIFGLARDPFLLELVSYDTVKTLRGVVQNLVRTQKIGAKFETENMKLFSSFPRRLIDDDSMTLADLNLFPNGVIHVV